MSTIAIRGGFSRDAAATITWSNAAGWQGNKVIYMNPNIFAGVTGSGTGTDSKGFGAYVLPEWNQSSGAQTKDVVVVNNSVGVAVGARSTDGGGNLMFSEFWYGPGGYLEVHIPIAVIGATYTNYSTDAECVYESLRNNYLSHVNMDIKWADNFGINVTGTLYPGAPPITKAQNDLVADAFWAAAEALPGVGTVHTWAGMYQTYMEAAKAVGSPNVEGFQSTSAAGLYVIQSYDVVNQTPWLHNSQSPTYDVFGSSMYVEVDINKTDFSTYPSSGGGNWTFSVVGRNWVGFWGDGCTAGNVLGAWMPLGVMAYPAIEVEGTVSLGSRTLANQALALSDGGSNVYTFSTNGQGNYRFFAKPGTTYTLTTTFENQQNSTVFTTGTDPTGPPQYENLRVQPFSATPSAYPSPTQVGYNEGFQTALSGAFVFPVSYSWNFGDGAWANGTDSPYHIYIQSGDFTVVLRASDSGNPKQWSNQTLSLSVKNPCSGTNACINPASQTVYYNKGGSCNIPTASFAGYAASTDQPPFQYSWAFGDGGTGSGQSISHTYPLITTTWTVTLTITNATGHKTTATATVTVKYLMACQPPP